MRDGNLALRELAKQTLELYGKGLDIKSRGMLDGKTCKSFQKLDRKLSDNFSMADEEDANKKLLDVEVLH